MACKTVYVIAGFCFRYKMCIRDRNNENMTMSGRIANNNCGSEVMNMVEMTEILAPFFGQVELMKGGEVIIGVAGPEVSVGIGMVVSERHGRIFGGDNLGSYKAGMSAHNSGVYAKKMCIRDSIIAVKVFNFGVNIVWI